jgi:hypothetical protein
MSNNKPNIFQVIFKKLFGTGKSSAVTSKTNEVILKRVNMHILEMEDVLFHLNSAVMMPENPAGESSTQGGGASEEQKKVSGLKALALVFKQFEFDPNMRMIITGHTDTSGTAEFNFKLSKERSENILYLLYKKDEEDSKKKWAEVCYNRQKVEDYQQILAHYEKKLNCGCDPGDIDDTWGDKTKKATENFLAKMEVGNVKIKAAIYEIQTDAKKRWPKSIWELVYDQYSKELAEVLEITEIQLDGRRKTSVKFVDDKQPILGCGESFPIDNQEKNNYRSQENRRVELLFFDKDEAPEIKCPVDIKKVHTEEECPLWRKFYFVPLYIDPNDLTSIVIHLKFVYYDKIKLKQLPVPNGLTIKAYEDGHKNIPTESIYRDGVYYVKVKFKNKIKDPARTQFYFEIETEDKYIYTKSDSDEPEIKTLTNTQFDNLTFVEKQNYYDLPKLWSSRNYWTRYDGDINKGDTFEKVFKDIEKLKPLGDKLTNDKKPLVFSFDDIVLTETSKSQILQDKNNSGNSIPLDDNSRYTLFYIDHVTKETVGSVQRNLRRLKIYDPETAQPVFTDVKFKKNLITDVPLGTRSVYFCNDFYDVGFKRTNSTDTSFNYTSGHVAGARLAIKDDPELQKSKSVIATNASDRTKAFALSGCGNYEMHYLHDCTVLDGKPFNHLIIYWNCRFVADNGGNAADITNHRKFGMVNAMNRMNKDYFVEKHTGSEDILLRLFFFMEAKNDTNGGNQKCMVSVTDNTNGAWMRTGDAKFRRRDYQADPTYFGATDPINSLQDVDGNTYAVLTNHHEMGHATGNWDSYLYNYEDAANNNWTGLPQYNQPFTAIGGPYRFDDLARMYHNRTPRIRNYWKYVMWMNDESDAGKDLHRFLNGSKYKITYQGQSHKHNFFLANQYRNVELAAFSDTNHSIASNHKVDLYIYKMGDDEFSILAKSGQVINGVLVVKIRLALKFINTGTGNWSFANSRAWAQRLNNDSKTMLDRKFRVATTTNNLFKNLFVVFTPSFQVYTGSAPGDSQYDIEVSWQNGGNFNTSGKRLRVDFDTDKKKIIRYFFGKTTGTANLNKNDFATIVTWVGGSGVANASYTMHNL